MFRTAIVAATLLAASHAATAGVRYTWENVDIIPEFGAAFGTIEITDSFWRFGESVVLEDPIHAIPVEPFGVDVFTFGSLDIHYRPVNLLFRPCGDECPGRPDAPATAGNWSFSLTLGDYLMGAFSANDTASDVRMSSLGSLWTIGHIASDDSDNSCRRAQNDCWGGTGRWVLDQSTVPSASPVPEPQTFAMMLAGLLMVGAAVKTGRRARRPGPTTR